MRTRTRIPTHPPGAAAAAALAALLALAAAPLAARAETDRFDAQNWKPALDGYGYVTVEGAKTLGFLGLDLAMPLSRADHLLDLPEAPPGRVQGDEVIDDVWQSDFVISLGVLPSGLLLDHGGLSIGVALPLIWSIDGYEEEFDASGRSERISGSDAGDLRTSAKLTLFDRDEDTVGLAVLFELQWSTGDADKYLTYGFRSVVPKLSLILEKRLFIFRGGVNVGWQGLAQDVHFGGERFQDRLHLSAAVALEPFKALEIPALETLSIQGELIHWTRFAAPWKNEETSPVEAGLAVRFDWLLHILLGVNAGLNDGIGTPAERVYLELGLVF